MRMKVDSKIAALHGEGVDYVEEMLSLLPTLDLGEFKVRESQAGARIVPGAYGNCKYPGRKSDFYRISISLKGHDDDFPWGIGVWGRRGFIKHAGVPRQEHVAENLKELLVFVSGHEYFHYACNLGYIPSLNSEENADAFGYEWMHSYRDGVEPVELAAWVDDLKDASGYREVLSIHGALKIANTRAPYAKMPPVRNGKVGGRI